MRHLKQEFDKLSFKDALTFGLAVFAAAAGFVLIFLGLYIPPEGQVHESVLTGFGISLMFSGSLLGISMHYANETAKFKDAIRKHLEDIIKSPAAHDDGDTGET